MFTGFQQIPALRTTFSFFHFRFFYVLLNSLFANEKPFFVPQDTSPLPPHLNPHFSVFFSEPNPRAIRRYPSKSSPLPRYGAPPVNSKSWSGGPPHRPDHGNFSDVRGCLSSTSVCVFPLIRTAFCGLPVLFFGVVSLIPPSQKDKQSLHPILIEDDLFLQCCSRSSSPPLFLDFGVSSFWTANLHPPPPPFPPSTANNACWGPYEAFLHQCSRRHTSLSDGFPPCTLDFLSFILLFFHPP